MNTATRILNRQSSLTLKHDYRAEAGEIFLYDEIGFWGVTASQFIADLTEQEADEITLRINSPGGDVFDGMAIFNAIRNDPRPITVEIDGLAASAASYIALAGDDVRMAENAFMMIHDAWSVVIGNAQEMRETAETLDKIDGQIAAMYARKSGGSVEDYRDLMDAETWFTAEEAKEIGLIDSITGEAKAQALFDLSAFNKAPAALKRKVEGDLRDVGFTVAEAKAAITKGFAGCREGVSDSDQREAEEIARTVDSLIKKLRG